MKTHFSNNPLKIACLQQRGTSNPGVLYLVFLNYYFYKSLVNARSIVNNSLLFSVYCY